MSDDFPKTYAAALRYGAGHGDLQQLLKAAREDPYNETLHGAIADALDEVHPGHPVAGLLREQFGLTGSPRRNNLWHDEVNNAWDGTFPYAARLGKHDPFTLYLRHEGQPSDRFEPTAGENQRWVLHAVSNQPGSTDFGYSFEFPHSEAHRLPQLFPAASKYIDPQQYPGFGSDVDHPAQRFATYEGFRNHEASQFDDRMDEEERSRS